MIHLAALITAQIASGPFGCAWAKEVPPPKFVPAGEAPTARYERTRDLMSDFFGGRGTLQRAEVAVFPNTAGVAPDAEAPKMASYPLKILEAVDRADRARHIVWSGARASSMEAMPSMLLHPGDRWCSPVFDVPTGARLRFDTVRVAGGDGQIVVEANGTAVGTPVPAAEPENLRASTQIDRQLPAGRTTLCFEAKGAHVALGEARVLEPDHFDKPQWIIALIIDALRSDALTDPDWASVSPTLQSIKASSIHYTAAITPGCHTRAALGPLFTGRDLARHELQTQSHTSIDLSFSYFERANIPMTWPVHGVGYHSVFAGNNNWMTLNPLYARFSSTGDLRLGSYDSISTVAETLARYDDERVFLTFYISGVHGHADTPERLMQSYGCYDAKDRRTACRCMYKARVTHGDEIVTELMRGLDHHGLADRSLQFVYSDHGDAFGDTLPLMATVGETESYKLNGAHGFTCMPAENRMTFLIRGPGIEPSTVSEQVSGLDVATTILEYANVPTSTRLDGAALRSGAAPNRMIFSYGFCNTTITRGARQFLWWEPYCKFRRTIQGEVNLDFQSEVLLNGRPVADSDQPTREIVGFSNARRRYLNERVPAGGMYLDLRGVGTATISIAVENGRITDFGPNRAGFNVHRLRARQIAADQLRIETLGYPGTFYVETRPPMAPVTIDVDGAPLIFFVGPLAVPISLDGRRIDPRSDESLFFAGTRPNIPVGRARRMGLWWAIPPKNRGAAKGDANLDEFKRVLREWGYIR